MANLAWQLPLGLLLAVFIISMAVSSYNLYKQQQTTITDLSWQLDTARKMSYPRQVYKPEFIDFCEQNKKYASRKLGKVLDWTILQGDSRHLSELLQERGEMQISTVARGIMFSGTVDLGSCCICDTGDGRGKTNHISQFQLYVCQNPGCNHLVCKKHRALCGFCLGCCAEEHGLDSPVNP